MLKYQVRTLGRERRRQSTPIREIFTNTSSSSSTITNITDSTNSTGGTGNGTTGSVSAPNSPWNDLSRARQRSTSVSSLSSASTSSESGQDWATIKIYTSSVRPDTDYKTLFANSHTTCQELIRLMINKFRIHFQDPELFYLTMELTTKHEANDIRHNVALDSNAKPLVLKSCYPQDRCRFVLQIRQSFPIRIYDSSFCTTSNYKTLMISQRTTCADALRMVMKTRNESSSNGSPYLDNPSDDDEESGGRNDYGIILLDTRTRKETILHSNDCLFSALYENESHNIGQLQLHLKPLRRRRRHEIGQQIEKQDDSMSNSFYRRRKITPNPMYSDTDYCINSLTNRLRDHVL